MGNLDVHENEGDDLIRSMFYKTNNTELELNGDKGTVIYNDKLIFKGFGYTAIKEYIRLSGNSEEASRPFKKQLGMREKCRFEANDRMKREEKRMAKK